MREILDLVPIIRVPQPPDFISGVINLRGKVLPIILHALPEAAAPPCPQLPTPQGPAVNG